MTLPVKPQIRIFTQPAFSLAAGGSRSADASLFRNDGDQVMWIHGFMVGGSNITAPIDEPRLRVRPTNGPMWSRHPIPVWLLPNRPAQHDWRFLHHYPLDRMGAMQVDWYNGHATSTETAMLALYGYKRGEAKGPDKYMAPRILWDRETGVANNSVIHGDPEEMRNWADVPMTVERIVVKAFNPGTGTAYFSPDALRVRVTQDGQAWMIENRRISQGCLTRHYDLSIPVPLVEVSPTASFDIEVSNKTGATVDIDMAIFGYAPVQRRAP